MLLFCEGVNAQNCNSASNYDTIPSIDGISGKCIILKREVLLNHDSLIVNQPSLKIKSFKLQVVFKGGMTELTSVSNRFTDDMKRLMAFKNTYQIAIVSVQLVDVTGNTYKPTLKEIIINIID
jgi:hypothetical protein